MAVVGQIREGELRPDQLEIGKVYRMEQYGRPKPGVPHRLIDQSLGRFNKIWGSGWGIGLSFMEFTIVAPGTDTFRPGRTIDIKFNTGPRDNYYWRFFQTAEDRLVTPFKQQALQEVFNKRIDPATAWGLSDGWFAPSKKSGGKKYKTRQTKLRGTRKNRTRKNRGRTRRR
jgi:hypothetical protein